MNVIYKLDEQQIHELYELYKNEWWTKDRSHEETKRCVNGSQINIGIIDDQASLQAYARVLTDYTFKAIVFDVIVSNRHRGKGLGDTLMTLIKNHQDLQQVKHFELYCLPEMFDFYEKYDFSTDTDEIRLMRFRNA